MSTVCVDQDHQIVSKARILDPGVLAVACRLLRPLEHTVYLIEVDVTEQWGDHSALWNAAATIRFQHDLQQVHHVIIVDSLCHLGQQQVVNLSVADPELRTSWTRHPRTRRGPPPTRTRSGRCASSGAATRCGRSHRTPVRSRTSPLRWATSASVSATTWPAAARPGS